jgi:hypothetical protein
MGIIRGQHLLSGQSRIIIRKVVSFVIALVVLTLVLTLFFGIVDVILSRLRSSGAVYTAAPCGFEVDARTGQGAGGPTRACPLDSPPMIAYPRYRYFRIPY